MHAAQPLLTVIVPIYNEAGSLPGVLPGLLSSAGEHNWKVLCINDGSNDASAELLAGFRDSGRLQVLEHKCNRGYGAALKTGILACQTPFLITFDGDGQHNPADIPALMAFAGAKQADLVVGDRGRLPASYWIRTAGKWIIRRFARALMPLPIRDLNSGLKLMRADLAKIYVSVCPDSMAFSDVITLVFVNQGRLVVEHPIKVNPRTGGRSTISLTTAFETIMEILNLTMLFNPLRIFLPLSAVCLLFGLGWGLPIVLTGRGVSVGAMLGIVTGLLFFFMGLIAGQLSAMRLGALERREPGRNRDEYR